jgi:hypothetical protein
VLLFALPCMALVSGCATLRIRNLDIEQHRARPSLDSTRSHWLMRFVSVSTVASAGILAIVGFHVITH